MSRKITKSESLVVGHVYGFGQSGNQFKVLWAYKDYLWVEWQSHGLEVETLPVNFKIALLRF